MTDALAAARALLAEQQTGRGAGGVVAAAAPLAAALGAEAIRAGGNAYDGAVAAALAETVLLPPKCGLGGDLVALCLPSDADVPEALLAIGGAPTGLADRVRERGLSTTGPDSVGVPGAPAGYAALAARGRLERARLADAAARLAEDGFAWAPVCTLLAEEARDLVDRHNPGGTSYYPDGHVPRHGQVMRLPGLAAALRSWSELGSDLLGGPVGAAIVERVRGAGGVLETDDLGTATAAWSAATSRRVDDLTVWATPAPTHGPALLDALVSAESDDVAALWRATQAAIARRDRQLADPGDGTSMVSAVDREGTVVVIVHSNSFPRFGSGLVVDEYDLILSNRAGRGFSDDPANPNFPQAGRRPATTLHAWAVGRDHPELLGGTPGGANQLTWNAQMLAEIRRGVREPGALVTSPRWEWLPADGGARVESDLGEAVDALGGLVARLDVVPPWSLRCAQQVVARPAPGSARVAAVDPRTGGAVVAV